MTRFFLAFFGTVILVLTILSVYFLKDSYKLLPIGASDPANMSEFASWYDFKGPKGVFEAKFPLAPQSATQSVQDPKTGKLRNYEMYVSEKANGSIFMVSIIEFPDNKESLEVLKKTIINDLLISNPQNQLKSMKVGTYKLFPTIEFVIANPLAVINGRTFSDGNVIYLLTGIFNNASFDLSEYEYFINSFEWVTPK